MKDNLYPIKIGPESRHVVDRTGKPFLIQGEAAWSLFTGLTHQAAAYYIENRRDKGFNTLIVNLIEHQFKGPVNRYAEAPFLTAGDFTTPNEDYFRRVDRVIEMAENEGIQILLAPIYLGYPGTNDGWYAEAIRNGPAKCREWGRYVGKRYALRDNIVWLMGGDRNPNQALELVNEVAYGIRDFDERHLMTGHTLEEHSPIVEYSDGGWIDLNCTYTYGSVQKKLMDDYARRPPIPFFLIESVYEGEWNASEVQIRRQAYWSILCGGTGQIMGNRPIWLFDPGWREAMESKGSNDMMRLGALFHSRPWHELVPDVRHDVVLDGLGEFRGFDYLAAARTRDGSCLIAYMPTARQFTVDLSKLKGPDITAWWYEPGTGNATSGGQFEAKGTVPFVPPNPGDWVIVLDGGSGPSTEPGRS
ncbi:MAG: glycoside hydrolase family 140 protein [Fimbriimonas sp.]|nr:glycoside hydrolase family 140 protein [Fimbriimonas sp.]